MAAYAALVNLLNTIDHIQDDPRLSITLQQNQIQLVNEKLLFLLDFVESSGPVHRGIEEKAEILERQIVSAACAAQDVFETHAADQIQAAAGSVSLLDLETVIQDMDYVEKKLVAFKEQIKDLKPTYVSTPPETVPLTNTGKSKMVGFDDKLMQLKDVLTRHESALKIIPIVGMGGIGKTTLAKYVYESSLILERFDIRAWATISLEYSLKDIFSNLLSRDTSKSSLETEYQHLAQELYQSLIGRRYLIVLDDMWSIDVWNKIKNFFPDNNNGSRVVVTTRQSDMAACLGPSLLQMQLLDKDTSWKLFCEKAFPNEGCCPAELVEIGMKIAKKCKGLPLLIIVVGALLRESSRTPEYWEGISNDINSILNTGDPEEMKNLDILCLSYRDLPAHLKPCFLYLGLYREDDDIRVSELIKLWVAEGFLRSSKTQSLEAVARGYLKDLMDRNLLISKSSKWNGETKICQMHDLLRELCLKIGKKERFLCVMRGGEIQQGIGDMGRQIVFHSLEQTTTRSLVTSQDWWSNTVKLLRVWKMDYDLHYRLYTLKQVNFRFIHISDTRSLVPSISLLWNLQTLIINDSSELFIAPPEIWEMRQLRHLRIYPLQLPDPPLSLSESIHYNLDRVFILYGI